MEFDRYGNELRRFPGSHLSSPLTYYPQRIIIQHYASGIEGPTEILRNGVKLLNKVERSIGPCLFTEDPSDVYHHCFSRCTLVREPAERKKPYREFSDLLFSCVEDLRESLNCIRAHHPALRNMSFNLDPQDLQDVVGNVYCAYQCYRYVTQVRGCIQSTYASNSRSKGVHNFRLGDLEVYVNGELIVGIFPGCPHPAAVLNYEQWLMICDTVSSRFLSILCCELNAKRQYDVLPTPTTLRNVYRWGDRMIKECRMGSYAVLGEYESIVTSVFVSFAGSDPLSLGKQYVEAVNETATEIFQEYGVGEAWTFQLLGILKEVQSVNILSELFGLRKHWGNPMVDAAASGRAVQEKLNEDLPIEPSALVELLASFNRMVTISFIRIHHQWPVCNFVDRPDGSSYPLKRAWSEKVVKLPEKNVSHRHLDWALMRFGCNCVTDTYENQLSFLSDKSVSLPVHELDHIYINGLRNEPLKGFPQHERRLLLEFLRKDQLPIMEILKRVMSDDIPEDWLANSAAMKGTEVKYLKARIFAVLTLELRQYFAVTEDMIKTHLFPYNPHQTMTMNETELMVKLRDITKQMDVDNVSSTLNVMHIVDFSKWNLRMRYENTHMIFRSIDDFLGFPGLVERSHLIFEEMVNLVQDPYNPPEGSVAETNSDTIWRMHTRGWEGQRQKGWTILTSALLSDLERITGIHSTICGQGDNQVLLTQFPIPSQYRNAGEWIHHNPDEVRQVLDNYYVMLEDKCSKVGLKVKTAESCRSLQYLNYGKRLFFRGIELSMTLKRISKSMTESNDAFPSSEVRLKTSQGASFAAGLFSHPSPWPYFMGRMCTLLILWESYHCNPLVGAYGEGILHRKAIDIAAFLSVISKIPSCFGGPPQQQLAAYLCRGHPDPLCEELVLLVMKARAGCLISRSILKSAQDGYWFPGTGDMENKSSLIVAPYSLNINTPRSAKSPIASSVLPALEDFCRNSQVKSILSYETTTYEDKLLYLLSKIEPFNPLVANDIYSRSIAGHRQSFVSGLKNATSICRLVSDSAENPIVSQIMRLEKELLVFWINSYCQCKQVQGKQMRNLDLHHVIAQQLRTQSWECEIVGVTVPHPLETFQIISASDDVCTHHDQSNHPEHIVVVRHSDNLFSPVGADSQRVQLNRSKTGCPYLGSHISEGLTSRQIVCRTATASWSDACRLNILRHWITTGGTNLDNLLRGIIETRTNASTPFLDLATGKPSRLSYSHRAALTATKKSCSITSTSNMYTRLYTSSNRMGKYSSGDLNYHLPYGPAFLVFGALLCMDEVLGRRAQWAQSPSEVYHCHMFTDNIPVVYDGTLELPVNCELSEFKVNPPALLYSKIENMHFDDLTSGYTDTDFIGFKDANLWECRIAYGTMIIGDMFIKEISNRELMALSVVQSFPKRSTPVTVGDLKMTGVVGLIRAIAIGVILVLGFERVTLESKTAQICSIVEFLSGFSKSFWSTFTSAMVQTSVVEKLRSIVEHDISSYDGALLGGLNPLLMAAVAEDACLLLEDLKKSITNNTKSPVVIVAPNFTAARHLYAKYAELAVWLVCDYAARPELSYKKGKKMSRVIHECTTMKECVIAGRMRFVKLEEKTRCSFSPDKIANIRLLSMTDPWLDRLRDVDFVRGMTHDPMSDYRVPNEGRPGWEADYIVGSNGILMKGEICTCRQFQRNSCQRVDGFYIRSGSLAVDPACILNSLQRFNLLCRNVLVINDKKGSVSRAIAELSISQMIYVCPCKPITEFDPHTAGTFIPPAFLNSRLQRKLLHPSSAAIIGDVLNDDQAFGRFESQVQGSSWDGAIILLPFSSWRANDEQAVKLRVSISKFAKRIDTFNWIVVLGSYGCHHQLKLMATAVSDDFELVSVSKPIFVLTGHSKVAIVGRRRRQSSLGVQDGFVSCQIMSDLRINDMFKTNSYQNVPSIMTLPENQQIAWTESVLQTQSNFVTACNAFIGGMGLSYRRHWTVGRIKTDIEGLIRYYDKAIAEVAHQQKTLTLEARGPRSQILNIAVSGDDDQVGQLAYEQYRCQLLLDILAVKPGDIGSVIKLIDHSIQSQQSKLVGDDIREFTVQASHFYDHYSFPLYCILGHIWKSCFISADSRMLHQIHYYRERAVMYKGYDFPLEFLPIDGYSLREDPRYLWPSRSKVMALVMLNVLHNRLVVVNGMFRMVYELLKRQGCEIELCSSADVPAVGCTYAAWIESTNDLEAVKDLIELQISNQGPCYVICSMSLISTVSALFTTGRAYRIPWSGLTPCYGLIELTHIRNACAAIDCIRTYDFSPTINTIYHAVSYSGCCCYDCVTENYLLEKVRICQGMLDKICTPRGMEDIYDVKHLF